MAALAVPPATTIAQPSRPDGRAPTLKVHPIEFIVGTSIDATIPFDPEECDFRFWHLTVPMRLNWHGKDGNARVDHYDVWAIPSYTEPYQVLDDTHQTSLDVLGGNYDSTCGSAPIDIVHRVEAYDRSGNVATVLGDTNLDMGAWQEDGSTIEDFPPGIVTTSRTGSWTLGSCTCSDAGHTLFSTHAGDSATYDVTPQWGGQSFAVVMPMSPDNGVVGISVDGNTPVLVDTFAATPQYRTVVWQTRLSKGPHTVVITNHGTAGRSRVDLDAVLLS